jgi:hypothetical protein
VHRNFNRHTCASRQVERAILMDKAGEAECLARAIFVNGRESVKQLSPRASVGG